MESKICVDVCQDISILFLLYSVLTLNDSVAFWVSLVCFDGIAKVSRVVCYCGGRCCSPCFKRHNRVAAHRHLLDMIKSSWIANIASKGKKFRNRWWSAKALICAASCTCKTWSLINQFLRSDRLSVIVGVFLAAFYTIHIVSYLGPILIFWPYSYISGLLINFLTNLPSIALNG